MKRRSDYIKDMKTQQKKGFNILTLAFVSFFLIPKAQAERAPAVAFLSANYESCTGYCEKENINCDPNLTTHGSVSWCEKNCLNRSKADEYQFVQGINLCRNPKTEAEK